MIFIEITSLGLVTTHIENLNSIFKETDTNYKRMIAKCMEVAMRASFYIYMRRITDISAFVKVLLIKILLFYLVKFYFNIYCIIYCITV